MAPSTKPVEHIFTWQFWLRLVWISVQLITVYFFISSDDPFFYQGF